MEACIYDVTLSDKIGRGGPLVRVDPAIMHISRAFEVESVLTELKVPLQHMYVNKTRCTLLMLARLLQKSNIINTFLIVA
jgi:hypothetical protein